MMSALVLHPLSEASDPCMCSSKPTLSHLVRPSSLLHTIDPSRLVSQLHREGDALILSCRIARCIDGMDLNLYHNALMLMRQHLQTTFSMASAQSHSAAATAAHAPADVTMTSSAAAP
jgi:hypothetical protein